MKKLTLFLIIIFCSCESHPQTFHKIGFRGGLIFTGMATSSEASVFSDSASFLNFLSYEFGVYAEMFNSKHFCLSTEFHYRVKGERNPNFNKVIRPVTLNNGQYYEYRYLSDRFHYISLQILPRYRIAITHTDENLYLFGGGVLDLLIYNTNSGDNETVDDIKNFKLDFGATAGIGIELMNFLTFEFRYEHSFRGPYELSYGDKTVTRSYNSLIFLTGISFNKLKL